MIGDLRGPAPGRRHEAYLLRKSELTDRLANMQLGKDFQGKCTAMRVSYIDRGFRGANLTEAQKASTRSWRG